MLLAILQISSGCYTYSLQPSPQKPGCSWGNAGGGYCSEQHPPRQLFDRPQGASATWAACWGGSSRPVRSCLSKKYRSHVGKGCLAPGSACGCVCRAAECPSTEEKVPHTSSVRVAKPQLSTFGTHGHRGTALSSAEGTAGEKWMWLP